MEGLICKKISCRKISCRKLGLNLQTVARVVGTKCLESFSGRWKGSGSVEN